MLGGLGAVVLCSLMTDGMKVFSFFTSTRAHVPLLFVLSSFGISTGHAAVYSVLEELLAQVNNHPLFCDCCVHHPAYCYCDCLLSAY